MSSPLPHLVLVVSFMASLSVGCSDDEGPAPDARPQRDAMFLIDGAIIDAPITADASLVDATTSDAAVTDAAAASPDANVDAMTCPTACPSANASTDADLINTEGIIIESVNIATSRITFRNVTGADKDITNWYLCFGPPGYPQITATAIVPANGTLTVVVGNGPCGGVGAGEVCVSGTYTVKNNAELGLYETNTWQLASAIRAYARWGTSDADAPSVRQGIAAGAGLWPATTAANDFVQICASHDGIVGTGTVTSAAGFASVDATCF